ncbi:hypothetical protein M4I32_15050 [Microbacterium sp. LRZ72]|uniref:hypothetical protein n=1 Tax=Microbacterium sp. LRZ72 TaxID=2942481 RepID=UPI0029A2AADF|nr:hypothetical protein [Microbacterium sp. LRZ72]MDX2378107.1 hypothetical protein [Microbacterium sp. LRZ72]
MSDVPRVEVGVPYAGWPIRLDGDYSFGQHSFSVELRDRIIEWGHCFDEHFDEEEGWTSELARVAHAREGELIKELVQEQLGDEYVVTLNTKFRDVRVSREGRRGGRAR